MFYSQFRKWKFPDRCDTHQCQSRWNFSRFIPLFCFKFAKQGTPNHSLQLQCSYDFNHLIDQQNVRTWLPVSKTHSAQVVLKVHLTGLATKQHSRQPWEVQCLAKKTHQPEGDAVTVAWTCFPLFSVFTINWAIQLTGWWYFLIYLHMWVWYLSSRLNSEKEVVYSPKQNYSFEGATCRSRKGIF